MSENIIQKNNLIHDFIDATTEALGTMASMSINIKNITEINGDSDYVDITNCKDITVIMGFSGGRKGSILVSFPTGVALNTVGGMLGIEFTEVDADVRDGIGEMVNVIAGGAKSKLQNKNIDFELSIPNIVMGANHHISAPSSTSRTRVEFETECGDFFLEFYLKLG